MRASVVFNPTMPADRIEDLREQFATRSLEPEWKSTTEEDPGKGQTEAAVEAGSELIIVCGGDGTVRSCAEALLGTGVPLAIIPAGTGNLLARNLEIPMDFSDALDTALSGERMPIDTGVANGETFTVMAGAGRDADIMEDTSSEAKDRLGGLAYVIEAVRHLNDEPIEAAITIDDKEVAAGSWVTILVANVSRLQGGVDLFPDSTPNDGHLSLLGIHAESIGETLAAGMAAALNSENDGVFRDGGRRFGLEFSSPTNYEIDGEPRQEVERLDIEVRPQSLMVTTPRRAE